MKSSLKSVRISPKKAALVASMLRGKRFDEASTIAQYSDKKAGVFFKKLLVSAAANAKDQMQLHSDLLYVSKAYVTQGATFKRGRSRSRGRVFSIFKRTSHLYVELSTIQ